MSYPPLRDYALIGDCHAAALVSRDGSVDWCCVHRFDGRPVFTRILDWRKGGYFRVAPTGRYTTSRRYLPGTNVLETTFETSAGRLVVTDCLPVRPSSDATSAEAVHPYHQLIRLLRCESGDVEVGVEFSPRFDYGRTVPRLERREADIVLAYGGADALVLQTAWPLRIDGSDGHTVRQMRAGEEATAVLSYMRSAELRPQRFSPEDIRCRVEGTRKFWEEWSGRCAYHGPYRDIVLRSALVLKALTNAPTGAVIAAPTTSLPEEIGGERNWDYRFTWLRDAAITLYALFATGYSDEAHAFMAWLARTTAGRAGDLQILYGIGGERLLPEVILADLDGYRGSRPVRLGNAAAEQFQLDVYGYLLDTAWLYQKHGGRIDAVFWEFLREAVDAVAARWQQPDSGIWEVRGPPRHFVSSKVMAWVAVDRAIRLSRTHGLSGGRHWPALRQTIRREIEAKGIDPGSGAFVQSFGSDALDASTLLIPLVGFLRPDDPRVRRTVERIARELAHGGLVYRYLDRAHDGIPGGEGTFVICSFWLVDNLALGGHIDRAHELFDRLVGLANDLGLLSEQVAPGTGELLGNFPQAFSHVGLIGAALNLEKGRRVAERASHAP